MGILREKAERESIGKDSAFTLQNRPVDLERVERHWKRTGLKNIQHRPNLNPPETPAQDVVCRTPPPPLPNSPPVIQHWRVCEKILYDVDILIKGSFEAGHWKFAGNEALMESSPAQEFELTTLNIFLGNLNNGCAAAGVQDFALAGVYWRQAFLDIEQLVKAEYHDVIPNLIQKVNDLNYNGLSGLAILLKKHIAMCSQHLSRQNGPRSSIYQAFGELDLAFMIEVEERTMKRYNELFEVYLGPLCYNSFVMMMDAARRRLVQHNWVTFEDCLPAVPQLDAVFGPSDRRTLDVIALRVDISSQRGWQTQTEAEAPQLIERAEMIENDEWQRLYHLTKGWYYLGTAQYMLKKRVVAKDSLLNALRCAEELSQASDFNIFDAQKVTIQKYLEDLNMMPDLDAGMIIHV